MFKRPPKGKDKYYEYYWSGDPAFDTESESFNHEAWRDTGDMAHLPVNGAERPSRFVLREFTLFEQGAIADFAAANPEAGNRYVQLVIRGALVRVHECFENGDKYEPGRMKIEGISCAEDDAIDLLGQGEGLVQELFEFITERGAKSPRG